MGGKSLGERGGSPPSRTEGQENIIRDRDMFLTEDIERDAHGPTSPKQPSRARGHFFGIAGTSELLCCCGPCVWA